MNRHEGVACRGCGKMAFTGRLYRCLSCRDFDICAECYDRDFTTATHLFDHPVKCVYTPADVELYFGGEYITSDPPQSYRCPYCKQWGFNESTFLEHVSAQHANASPLLVSTMVTLFEQQQAARLFLEDEQLASFSAAVSSRNQQIGRTSATLDLYLEPLNPDGSYRRPGLADTFTLSKPAVNNALLRERAYRLRRGGGIASAAASAFSRGRQLVTTSPVQPGSPAVITGHRADGNTVTITIASPSGSSSSSSRIGSVGNNSSNPLDRRPDGLRLSISESVRARFQAPPADSPPFRAITAPDVVASPAATGGGGGGSGGVNVVSPQPAPQVQQPLPLMAGPEMLRFYGGIVPLGPAEPYHGSGHRAHLRSLPRTVPWLNNQSANSSGRTVSIFGPTSALASQGAHATRAYLLPTDSLVREHRHRTTRLSTHHQNSLSGAGSARSHEGPSQASSHHRQGSTAQSRAQSGRTVDFHETPTEDFDMMTLNAAAAECAVLYMHEDPELAKKRELERQRFLCYRFLAPRPARSPVEQMAFLSQRSEFVAQLLASTLCDEQLLAKRDFFLGLPLMQPRLALQIKAKNPSKNQRPSCDTVGAGDAEKISRR